MASASEAELALLSGEELVDHLRTTYRRADFDAVARVLNARDRRMAQVEAALDAASARERVVADAKAATEATLADLDALRKKYEALLGAHRRPGHEADEMALLAEVAAPDPVHRDELRVEEAKEGEVKGPDFVDLCSDEEKEEEMTVGPRKDSDEDEEDTEPLSQRWKRLRRDEPGAMESENGDGQGQSNSVGTLGNDQQISPPARMECPVARTGQMVGTPEDSKAAALVQGRGVVKPEKFDGEMPRAMLLPSPGLLERSAVQKGSSKSDHRRAEIDEKEGSSYGVPARGDSQPPNGDAKMNKTPMVQSSAKCGNKEVGADMQKFPSLLRQSEEKMIAWEGVPFEAYNGKSTSVQVKRERSSLPSTITRDWKSEGHMIVSLLNNNYMELSMQALCALYRQRKLTIENTGLSKKFDASRATKLAEFLLGGDLQGPLIRTPEELENHDATASSFLQQVTLNCSEQLFNIFRNKEDPYFC